MNPANINTMEIHFVFRRSTAATHMGTIQCRITVNKVRVAVETVSTSQVHSDHWDRAARRVTRKSRNAETVNVAINTCEARLLMLFRQYDSFQRPLTARQLLKIYRGDERIRSTIPELVKDFLADKVKVRASAGTIQTYGFKFRPLVAFLKEEGKLELYADEFKPHFLERYRTYLISSRKNKDRAADKTCQSVKTLLIWAYKTGRMTSNPLEAVTIHVDKTPTLTLLDRDEVALVENAVLTPALRKVADCYLFSCYTGIAYQDMLNLRQDSVQLVENRLSIVGKRQKTGTPFIVPISLPVRKLMITYGGCEMPLPENRRYNRMLKEVMMAAGVKKSISSHTARKTFADWCLNELNMSKEATTVAMGQINPRELDAYARIRPKRLMAEFPDDV